MEFQNLLLLKPSQTSSTFLLSFFTTILICVISLLLLLFKRKLWCNCNICHTYLTKSWSKEFNNLCDWYTHLLQNSPSQTIHIHVLNNTITANPRNVEHILKTQFENYPKGKPFSSILGDFLGNGIFNVDGDLWMFQRKMASLELGSMPIRSYAFQIVTNEIKFRLLPLLSSYSLRNNQVLDLQDVFKRFSFDNICKFSFGLDPGCLELSLPLSHFANFFDLASKLSAERAMVASPFIWKIKRFLNLGSENKLKEAIRNVHVLAEQVIRQKRKLGFSTQQDLLSRFMASNSDDIFLMDIVKSFILAGRDTMASGLTTFFFLLATHPEVMTKIREESKRVMRPGQELPSFDQLREMHYLHAAVYESMRLYPPIQFDSKFARETDILPDGTRVKMGTRVTYHPYAMGRVKSNWGSDCLLFRPERWLKNGVFCPQCPYKYPIFQAGIRVCLGKEMALVEMKSVAVCVLHGFDIELVEPLVPLGFEPGLTATLRGGLRVIVRERVVGHMGMASWSM
ncbi:Cytochrome P450 [Dillenia turbinata]|uniref:Cytochrome P450 n=1 Tax=Dillenia turbinata TaxID=194707 RepID=A0AAN8ZGD5_9MAGN